MAAKLYTGGGDEMLHSSVGASQGSWPAGAPFFRLRKKLCMKISMLTMMTNTPMVASTFISSHPKPEL